jgi:outer membrane protein assembly factor BamA
VNYKFQTTHCELLFLKNIIQATGIKSLIFCMILLCWSCSPTKYLRDNQYLLTAQKVKGNKQIETEELISFFKQKPNHRFLGLPVYRKLWSYNRGLKTYNPDAIKATLEEKNRYFEVREDSLNNLYLEQQEKKGDTLAILKKLRKLKNRKDKTLNRLQQDLEEGNWLMRNGEPPAVLDTNLASQTARQMHLFLQKRGFFNNTTSYRVEYDTAHQMATVTYFISENKPYYFNEISYELTEQTHIDSLIKATQYQSLLQKGSRYNKDNIEKERERINKLLRNNGYMGFNREYITFSADTTIADSTSLQGLVDIKVIINSPEETTEHQRYTIDRVYFIGSSTLRGKRDTVQYKNINYLIPARKNFKGRYSKSVLNSKITIRQGDYYSQEQHDETTRRLGGLDIFRFVNVVYDTIGTKLKTTIFTNPLERFQTSEEAGGTVSQGLPGPAASWTLKIRNPFKGLEVFELTARASIEGQTGFVNNDKVYASQEASINPSIVFPKILIPTTLRYKFDPYRPRTRMLLGFNYSNRPEYTRRNLRAGMVYNWQVGTKRSYTVSLVDINYVRTPRKDQAFIDYLNATSVSNGQLLNSFTDGFVSGINASYTYNDFVQGVNEVSRYWRFYLETGGAFLNLLTPLLDTKDRILGNQFYRFYRMSIDFRHYRPITRTSQIAFRINGGFANTYGNTQSLPYEKFFFAGGSNSVRAWSPRRLGLGSAPPPKPTQADIDAGRTTLNDVRYRYEQQGNILLEMSAEYRFKVFKYLNMALFSDAGNLWTIKALGDDRPNANFALNRFYKELAWGGGIGLRLDFSFLIIRADLATKFYEPYRSDAGDDPRWRVSKITWQNLNPFAGWQSVEQQTLLNVGIGYPF